MRGLSFLPVRRRRRPIVNVTSLIDVLFLLLIFIMVSSTFTERPAIRLQLPRAAQAERARVDETTLTLAADGGLYLDGRATTLGELEEALRRAVAEEPELALNLEGDEAVGYGRVIAAIDAARAAGVRRVSAFTAREEP